MPAPYDQEQPNDGGFIYASDEASDNAIAYITLRMMKWDAASELSFENHINAVREGDSNDADLYASEAHEFSDYASALEGELDLRPSDERTER